MRICWLKPLYGEIASPFQDGGNNKAIAAKPKNKMAHLLGFKRISSQVIAGIAIIMLPRRSRIFCGKARNSIPITKMEPRPAPKRSAA